MFLHIFFPTIRIPCFSHLSMVLTLRQEFLILLCHQCQKHLLIFFFFFPLLSLGHLLDFKQPVEDGCRWGGSCGGGFVVFGVGWVFNIRWPRAGANFYCKNNRSGPSVFTGGNVILKCVGGCISAPLSIPINTAPVTLLICHSIPLA